MSLRFLAVLNAVFLLTALGCGDTGGGCGPAPEKKEEPAGGGGGGGISGNKGSSSGAAELITSDKKGRVPKGYRRPASAYEPTKSTATISRPVIASPSLPVARITKRKLGGVADRVEVACRIIAISPDGDCSGAKNYAEIKERCCPGGLVERCKTTLSGVVLVGRGCEPLQRPR